jgi:hypothetical protein
MVERGKREKRLNAEAAEYAEGTEKIETESREPVAELESGRPQIERVGRVAEEGGEFGEAECEAWTVHMRTAITRRRR